MLIMGLLYLIHNVYTRASMWELSIVNHPIKDVALPKKRWDKEGKSGWAGYGIMQAGDKES